MANNLKDHLKEVGDAIRAKEGTSDLINPQDFATKIGAISGGSESGGSNIEYLDVSGEGIVESAVSTMSWMAKASVDGMLAIAPTNTLVTQGIIGQGKFPIAVMIDLSAKVNVGQGLITLKDFIVAQGLTQEQLDAIPRLTKEQFYDLNS